MKYQKFQITGASILPAVAIALAAGIFAADTLTESEIAFPAFYTAIVLIAARFCTKRGITVVGVGCIALILLSDLLTIDVTPSRAGIANTVISLVAITATTYLAAKFEMEKESAYQARSQLAHVVRVTTVGELTSSIAHQINQPLAAMAINSNACLHWLDANPPNLDEARKNIARIAKDADRASEVIAQVRNLTKGSPSEATWVSVKEIILSTVGFLDREIQQNQILLQTELSDVSPVLGNRVQLQQVVLNLLLNAIETLNQTAFGPRELLISSTQRDSKNVLVTVKDTGAGFMLDDPDRLFDAFYTTKQNGMGMGLAISRSIVESHGGRIWAIQNKPAGAAFHFLLPTGAKMHPQVAAVHELGAH